MNKEELFKLIKDEFDVEPDYPWPDDPYCVFRHVHNRKWFCVCMTILPKRIGLAGDKPIDIIDVKCDPLLIGSLVLKEGFHRAYHMNKEKWITIRLDGSVSKDEILDLLDLSYRLTE